MPSNAPGVRIERTNLTDKTIACGSPILDPDLGAGVALRFALRPEVTDPAIPLPVAGSNYLYAIGGQFLIEAPLGAQVGGTVSVDSGGRRDARPRPTLRGPSAGVVTYLVGVPPDTVLVLYERRTA